ncbi:synembryn [Diorhabda sublineata]|uniref:synembryn n=1 Tax=Diorhabda sublineata TaxID=1163346 RepID=UPI0024E059B7|nr:synembryn [Diorhabda sublineata]
MNVNIDDILLANKDNWSNVLETFVNNALTTFSFPELTDETKRRNVWDAIYNIANCSEDPNVIKNCFIAVRILSRETNQLYELINYKWMDLIKKHSGLNNEKFEFSKDKTLICIEVMKSLSNILFNSRQLASKTVENGILEGLTNRIKQFKNKNIPDEVKFMDAKLLFLITALSHEARKYLNMIEPLLVILEDVLHNAAKNHVENEDLPTILLTDAQADLVSEILKALFNLTIRIEESHVKNSTIYIRLVKVLRSYLLISSVNSEKTWTLRNNVVNLLTNMPEETYTELFPASEGYPGLKSLEFEGMNMTAIYEILMFLKAKFNCETSISNQHEIFSPVVTVLLKGATSHRAVRKFLKNQILPPLKDVHSRPEQGSTLRNHLCRLLTTPTTELRDLVAELLFVLCKKSVARMIKYTGYGNAAGLFAKKGLLAGGEDKGQGDYSDSEDSETEEYADHKHGINPVIGCYEEPHPSVLDTMSEEQREYEAMKLVELIDSLMKCGVIKPCVVGEDGKPKQVTHVLELQDQLKNKQITFAEDSD